MKNPEQLSVKNSQLSEDFSGETGLLTSVTSKEDSVKQQIQLSFVMYGVKMAKEKSGAYLFLPDGEAQPVAISKPFIHVLRGPLMSEVKVMLLNVEHVVWLQNSPGAFSIYHIHRRRTLDKLLLRANYYPMPTVVYLEDDIKCITMVTAQAPSVASLKQGQFEIMQDQRLCQDNNRGLGQGVLDNKRTPNKFRLFIERRTGKKLLES
ncbi:alpha-mannosidase 2x-like [Liolophura sinensis]|uniref:alpha-mannosidase 2x-like n=1 Tax=Liolophura sinensis TaxID=3198878 RepID=UPI003158A845